MAGPSSSRLFKPLKVGKMQLQHRITMCPMTRCRITGDHVPQTQVVKEYYKQRACVPGTLIVSEGILCSKRMAGGFPSPGIWSQEQIGAWKEITEEVHRQGCFIVAQLFGFGRAASEEGCRQEGFDLVGPSAIPIDPNHPTPRAMTLDEIKQTVADFAQASRNAIEAGFDGVECHGANGYLLNQFLQEVSNQRDDQYGGSIENRSRLILEVLEAMIGEVGADRVGLRLSPFSPFQGMAVSDPYPQPTHLISKVSELGLMYLSMVEGRISGSSEGELDGDLDFAYQLWKGPFIAAGGYTTEKAKKLVDQERTGSDIIVGFGRSYVSNPDLVYRVARDILMTKYDRSTFYTATPEGYTDYPASKDFTQSIGVLS